MELRRIVGLNARRLREAAELSQDAVAESMGVEQGYLSRIEAGQKNLTLDTLELLARALRVNPSELCDPDVHSSRRARR